VIRVVNGELYRVVAVAEEALADSGQYYHRGGLIVNVSTNPITGDPAVVPANLNALARVLSYHASWEKYDGRSHKWVATVPPDRPVRLLLVGRLPSCLSQNARSERPAVAVDASLSTAALAELMFVAVDR
jgi:hypothetical protein